jgi:uncharacterized damage-inducible protein DinB
MHSPPRESPVDHTWVADVADARIVSQWNEAAWRREPYWHARLVALALALVGVLSPYVLVEIVAWLPEATRFAALRTFLVSHTIHHRGQMTVYLRLQNVPLPPLYGPSADESM